MIDVSLALPFTLGIVTTINPCGFAMLPTWLGYFLGRDRADGEDRPEPVSYTHLTLPTILLV